MRTNTNIEEWIGRQETSEALIDRTQLAKMIATMSFSPLARQNMACWQSNGGQGGRQGVSVDGDSLPNALPPGWHWAWFNAMRPASELGRDGHPEKGGFLPPVSLPRRMWAGGRLRFERPIEMGAMARKVSTIETIAEKNGRSGKLCFITVRHEIFVDETLCITEWQDIVYREDERSAPAQMAGQKSEARPEAAPAKADGGLPADLPTSTFSVTVKPDPVWLFRYSALTFNGHRIHYDLDYARNVEGYRHLVFHGPLTATLLMELAETQAAQVDKRLAEFSFRAVSPLFADSEFSLHCGAIENEKLELWATNGEGKLAMRASARLD